MISSTPSRDSSPFANLFLTAFFLPLARLVIVVGLGVVGLGVAVCGVSPALLGQETNPATEEPKSRN